MRDHRDLVIEKLAASERDLAVTCAGLREALHAALGRLHDQDVETEHLRDRCHRLTDETRAQRRAA